MGKGKHAKRDAEAEEDAPSLKWRPGTADGEGGGSRGAAAKQRAKDMRKAISANRIAHAVTDNHQDEFRSSVRRQSSCCQKERAGRRCRGDRKKREPAAGTGGCLAGESVLAEASTPM